MDIEKLKKIGGSEWIKNEHHRIYFNNLPELFGLTCSYYKTGNIFSATLDGEKISNGRAREIETILRFGKIWYNVKTEMFEWKLSNCRDFTAETIADEIIDEIKKRAAEVQ